VFFLRRQAFERVLDQRPTGQGLVLFRPIATGPDTSAGGRYHAPQRIHHCVPGPMGGGGGGALVAAPGSTIW